MSENAYRLNRVDGLGGEMPDGPFVRYADAAAAIQRAYIEGFKDAGGEVFHSADEFLHQWEGSGSAACLELSDRYRLRRFREEAAQ